MTPTKNVKETSNQSDSDSKWRSVPKWQIIALLILFFPVGLYLLWRQDRWSNRTKKIATSAFMVVGIAFFALIIMYAPPTVTITSSSASVKSANYQVIGKVTPSGSIVTVNGTQAKVVGDTFSSNVQLKEGDNTLKIVVVSGSKRIEKEFKIHRYTKSEVIALEKAAAKKKADAAAEQAKKQQVADDKAKADADAAKKQADDAAAEQAKKQQVADDKATTTPPPAKTPVPTVTISQKNALSKAKAYLSYTAFSHDGLVDQLVYEQFSTTDAIYGADNVGANWNEQAAKKAQQYMSYSSFSRGSLIDQLVYEKFTLDQATYGANAVGL